MGDFNNFFNAVVDKANAHNIDTSNCYVDDRGILTCNTCGKHKQTFIPFNGRIINCPCECDQKAEEAERKKERDRERIKELYRSGVTDKLYLSNCFDNDDGLNPDITAKCVSYVEHWKEMKQENVGMLLYGDVGTGKSFYACCVGNALLQKGVPVLITTLSKLVENRIAVNRSRDVPPVKLSSFDLLILDDLGVENATQTAYNIIDDWYRSGKPLIVTTNLTPNELKKSEDIQHRRIFDRVIERCGGCPIKVNGEKRRYNISQQKRTIVDSILNSRSVQENE